MIMHGIDIEVLAQDISEALGTWMLSEIGPNGLRDAVHESAGPEYDQLNEEQRHEVVAAVDKEIYG